MWPAPILEGIEIPCQLLVASALLLLGILSAITGCNIKDNNSINIGARIYHVPSPHYYEVTKVSARHDEKFFVGSGSARGGLARIRDLINCSQVDINLKSFAQVEGLQHLIMPGFGPCLSARLLRACDHRGRESTDAASQMVKFARRDSPFQFLFVSSERIGERPDDLGLGKGHAYNLWLDRNEFPRDNGWQFLRKNDAGGHRLHCVLCLGRVAASR